MHISKINIHLILQGPFSSVQVYNCQGDSYWKSFHVQFCSERAFAQIKSSFSTIHTHYLSITVKHHTNTSLPAHFQKANSFQHTVIKLLANLHKISSQLLKFLSSWNLKFFFKYIRKVLLNQQNKLTSS